MYDRLEKIENEIITLLDKSGVVSLTASRKSRELISFNNLAGDGSGRIFVRVFENNCPLGVAVFPSGAEKRDMAEFRSAFQIARHLYEAGVPVPQVIGVDETVGLIIFEDLGDLRLHESIVNNRDKSADFLRKTIKVLAKMQVQGAVNFKQDYCFDTPSYDRNTMLERESGYFVKAFWEQTLFEDSVVGLKEEFELLADRVMMYYEPLFFHRDFQSRNIMICNGEIRVIDFQAGRLGPPGYDIASLLIDPYMGLSDILQSELFQLYLDEMSNFTIVDVDKIVLSYPYLAVQRNLQIIGAFAYLSGKKGKSFFKPYILPSLIMLQNRLEEKEFNDTPIFKSTVSLAIQKYRRYIQG